MVGRMGLEPTYDMVYKTIATTSLATALYFGALHGTLTHTQLNAIEPQSIVSNNSTNNAIMVGTLGYDPSFLDFQSNVFTIITRCP